MVDTYSEDIGLTTRTIDISSKVEPFSIRRDSWMRHAVACYVERQTHWVCPFVILSNRTIKFQEHFLFSFLFLFFFRKRHLVVTSKVDRIHSSCEYRAGFVQEGVELRRERLFFGKLSIAEFSSEEVIIALTSPVRGTTSRCFTACCIYYLIFSIESSTIFREFGIDFYRFNC